MPSFIYLITTDDKLLIFESLTHHGRLRCQQRFPSRSERQLARRGNRLQALKQIFKILWGFSEIPGEGRLRKLCLVGEEFPLNGRLWSSNWTNAPDSCGGDSPQKATTYFFLPRLDNQHAIVVTEYCERGGECALHAPSGVRTLRWVVPKNTCVLRPSSLQIHIKASNDTYAYSEIILTVPWRVV